MTEKEFSKLIRTNILGEFMDKEGNETVIYFDYVESENEIVAGTLSNCGIIGIVSHKYDSNFHIEGNIMILNDLLIEKGYYPM